MRTDGSAAPGGSVSAGAAEAPALRFPDGDLWVFAYGSLMWRPGFEVAEARRARLHGYHRALCVWSWEYRGTRSVPGLVLGLDRGGTCVGRALRVRAADKANAIRYLYRRELSTGSYCPTLKAIRLGGERPVPALAFVVDRACAQYAGKLSVETVARVVARAQGDQGANRDYLLNTVAHLDALGIYDRVLHRVQALLEVPGDGEGHRG